MTWPETVHPGDRFGRLVVLRRLPAEDSPSRHRWYIALCDCGCECTVQGRRLAKGRTRSCGCLRRHDAAAQCRARSRHGHAGDHPSPTYRSWQSMVTRCTRPGHSSWENYGGRGITVCDRWRVFDAFLEDMGQRPEGRTLDRVDVNGDYEPGNCRWATLREQRANQRNPRAERYQAALEAIIERPADAIAIAREALEREAVTTP